MVWIRIHSLFYIHSLRFYILVSSSQVGGTSAWYSEVAYPEGFFPPWSSLAPLARGRCSVLNWASNASFHILSNL